MAGPGKASAGRKRVLRQQQGNRPYRAVVLRENCGGAPNCLAAGDFERDAAPWKVERQSQCPRIAHQMAGRVERLLVHSNELVLVDRHFDPREPRWQRPFAAFVALRRHWKRLELHTALPAPFNLEVQAHNYRQLQLMVPEGVNLQVVLWPEIPHPRFLLTERGGVNFEWGLDEGHDGTNTTLVTLLEQEVFLGVRADYCARSRKFGEPREITVQGQG